MMRMMLGRRGAADSETADTDGWLVDAEAESTWLKARTKKASDRIRVIVLKIMLIRMLEKFRRRANENRS